MADGTGKRVALVIGNGGYDINVNAPPLKNPCNDATGMSGTLTRLGFDVITGLDLSVRSMLTKLDEFEDAIVNASAALLFYAGHGLQVMGHNYLIPVDARIFKQSHLRHQAFSLDEVLTIMVRRARANLVFLDACRDNPFARSLRLGMTQEEQKRFIVRAGLAEVKASQGSFIAFATAPDNVASDGRGDNSPFTEALLTHIEKPGLSVNDLMIDVRNDVLQATAGAQEPWDQSSLRERFYFVPEENSAQPSQDKVTPGVGAIDWLAEWSRIKDSTDIATLTHFANHAHAYYAGLANKRISFLEAEARAKAEAEARAKAEAEAQRRREEEDIRAGRIVRVMVGLGSGRDESRLIKPGSGESFQDAPFAPEMVVVPAGEFMMGAPEGEEGRSDDEGPQHKVIIPHAFAVGRYAVTFDEWDAAQADKDWQRITGIAPRKPDDKSWGRSDRPVIDVNWGDAQAYIKWLKAKTGKEYRLLSEAEWEYAARAGTTTPFWWGKSISTDQANYDGNYTFGGGSKGEYRQKTVPVKSFQPNPWGLYQVHGNVWEWCEDSWHDSYNGAPDDGSAWTDGQSSSRVLRGGSWINGPRDLRSAFRLRNRSDFRGSSVGFRVSRTLNL